MKKNLHVLFLFLILSAGNILAQVPMFFNTNAAGGANAFPLNNSATSRKVQWFIPPNTLGTVGPGNNITDVYFQAGSTATRTYPILTVKLKTGSGTGLTGVAAGPIEAGMTTVYSGVNVTISSTLGSWIKITLTTPWLYNPSVPLIVELEHNATTGTGPSLYQNANIPGPGNGRQWADYNVGTITGIGTNQINFGIDVLPATPCTVAPAANTITPVTLTTCPGLQNPNLTLANTYSFGGITYQWQSSTLSPVGPFTSIPNSTLSFAPTGSINVSTWYQLVATCTNVTNGTTTITGTGYIIGNSVVKTVPYIEDFEGIQVADRLPNCSWFAQNLGSTVKTYMSSNSDNRVPRSGTKFGSFGLPSTNNIVYTNGITMSPGVTYSAAIHYATEYFGYSNWSSLTLLVGPNQSTTGLVPIATVSPAISGAYKLLSGIFTVPSAGDYYVAIRANSTGGSALYLSWDDFSVTVPCYGPGAGNSPTVSVSAGSNTICAGDQVNITANGADMYFWDNGAITSAIVVSPQGNISYTVTGTNTLTGCSVDQVQNIYVNPTPSVFVVADKTSICPGETVFLTAYFADVFSWSNGGTGSQISVTPTLSTAYSVIGTNLLGCAKTSSLMVNVKPRPTIVATSLNAETCAGEVVTLNATGGATYEWFSSSNSVLLQGNPVYTPLNSSTTFTVVGKGSNGCTNTAFVNQIVVACTGIDRVSKELGGLKLYPNPSNGLFNVELQDAIILEVQVLDVTGRVVLTVKNDSNNLNIDISSLSNGIYYARITSDKATGVVQISKN